MWGHYSSETTIRWFMGKTNLIFIFIWFHIYDSDADEQLLTYSKTDTVYAQHSHTHTQFSVYPAPILIYQILLHHLRRKSMRNWVLKISCCIFHIKPTKPLALFLFMQHYVTSDPLLWQMRIHSLHLQTSQIVWLYLIYFIWIFCEK